MDMEQSKQTAAELAELSKRLKLEEAKFAEYIKNKLQTTQEDKTSKAEAKSNNIGQAA